MEQVEWDSLFVALADNLAIIQGWPASPPEPEAARCEESRHRTLAHLRACQEQWLVVAEEFIKRESATVKILHPWRQFEARHYELESWENHMARFVQDRFRWLELRDIVDASRGGTWNRKPDTIGGLTKRLADHETYHIRLVANLGRHSTGDG